MAASEDLDDRVRRARAQLLAIPGVAHVGFGLKEAGGNVEAVQALRVYVAYKRPVAQLDPAERIPPTLEGIATDVISGFTVGLCSRGTVSSGDKIVRDNVGGEDIGAGTVGMFVQQGTRRLLLTNNHVLFAQWDTAANRDIYSPKVSCHRSFASFPSDLQGKQDVVTYSGTQYWVDAQLADIVDGAKVSNNIPGIGAVAGIHDITSNLNGALNLHVSKRGMRTGITRGTIVDLHAPPIGDPNATTGPAPFVNLGIVCDAANSFQAEFTYQLTAGQNNIAGLKNYFATSGLPFTGTFSNNDTQLVVAGKFGDLPGDSGSIWVDDTQNVVGLHYGTVGVGIRYSKSGRDRVAVFGRQVACAIVPVFNAVGLGATPTLMPATPSAGVAQAPDEWPEDAALRALEDALAKTAGGRRLLLLGRRHYAEIAELVHHRRRVTVAWHRHRGPSFSAEMMRSLCASDRSVPPAIGGVSLVSAMTVMRDVLMKEADPVLRDDLREHGEWLIGLVPHVSSTTALLAHLESS